MVVLHKLLRTVKTEIWWMVTVLVMVMMVTNVSSLSGPNVCMVKQKYNITKRVKYRAPMSVRTYEWCFAMPPRCSKWSTEMRDVTRLETEERTAEMADCCPGFKLRDISCVPTCPSGKTGQGCSEDCPPNKWGPSCIHECKKCVYGSCNPLTGECRCQDGWQGESCEISMTTTAAAEMMEQLLTTETTSTKTTTQTTPIFATRSSKFSTTATLSTSTSNFLASSTTTTTPALRMANTSTSSEIIRATIPTTPATTAALLTTSKIVKPTTILTTPTNNVVFSNVTLFTEQMSTLNTYTIVTENQKGYDSKTKHTGTEDITKKSQSTVNSSYNRTEVPSETVKIIPSIKTVTSTKPSTTTTKTISETTARTKTNDPIIRATTINRNDKTFIPLTTTTVKPELKKISTTLRQPTTTQPMTKEIWIKPAQKGESPIVETKLKLNQEPLHSRFKHKEPLEITTPKTIIVSIIPTSVTYVTFKKLALTTVSSIAPKNNVSATNNRTTEQEFTKPMTVPTTLLPSTITYPLRKVSTSSTIKPLLHQNVTKSNLHTSSTRRTYKTALPTNQTTNSMTSTLNVANKKLNSSFLTTVSSFPINVTRPTRKLHPLFELTTSMTASSNKTSLVTEKSTIGHVTVQKQAVTSIQRNVTNRLTEPNQITKTFSRKQAEINSKRNITNSNITANTVTDDPSKDEETFHILTEPEHITAVMGDKASERSTINLISVISIAGGVMMAVISVAVVIVMLERCKKPRYEDVRKFNDIRMQVMIDNNDVPPPYVRSIFHTPLPEPPTSEKCHYQPISTLDRNLKQFMRPVVVQTISPLMLENFRGILECHYDHLPRRTQEVEVIQTRCSVVPSIDEREELLPPPCVHSLTDSDIEAMKCEAKLDVIDNTTSEPLYAEIPCWRPPSAHAIEVVNLNGEAVTEL